MIRQALRGIGPSRLARFNPWLKPSNARVIQSIVQSVRFYPSWKPTDVRQIHGLIALLLDVQARTERHAEWVEVGSLHGESATLMLAFPFVERLHCIDVADSPVLTKRLGPFLGNGRCVFHHGTSRKCADAIGTVDIAYIDGDHSYPAVKDDIGVWYPKVAVGGALCGHDYHMPSVQQAVLECVTSTGMRLTTYEDSSWMILKTA